MDFFSRGYTALRGERGQPQSADETIEKLADCLETATLLEDRRAGVLSLKGLVRDWPEEVGNKSFPGLIKVLHTDYKDIDITKSLLETITILCTVQHQHDKDDRGFKFTDYFIEDSRNVTILLDILEEFDFYVRYNTIKLLSTLLSIRSKRIQECILTNPMGISLLVDMLDDKRDVIRNEGLLLLIGLTRNNTEIQKIVTFQATFEKLLAIIEEQEGISGDIIVQDSLTLMHNLLRYNVSDQVYFRETSCIQQIPGLLGYVGDSEADHVPYSFEDWPPQKVANTVLVLQLIRILTEPDSSSTPTNQRVMVQSGILLPIIQLGLCSNAPSIVRTEALYAIAYVVAANPENQMIFGKVVVASPPVFAQDGQVDVNVAPGIPRAAIVSLISIAVSHDVGVAYSYSSRAAATFAVYSCLEENPDAQLVLVSTLKTTPPGDNANSSFADKPYSAGSLLLEVIENWEQSLSDPYKVWFACDVLSHVLRGNEKAKHIVNTIVFGDEASGEDPVPFMHQIVAQLLMSTKNPSTNIRIPIGYLCLLCTWLYESPNSVSLFLSESTHVQFLIQEMQSSTNDPTVQGLVAYLLGITYEYNDDPSAPLNRAKLQGIYSSRLDQFNSLLARLRDSPAVKNAPQYLQISAEDESVSNATHSLPSLILDNVFVDQFKSTYEHIQKSIKKKPTSFNRLESRTNSPAPSSPVVSDEVIQVYKNTIEEKSNQIKSLEEKVAELETSLQSFRSTDELIRNELKTAATENTTLKERISELESKLKETESKLIAAPAMNEEQTAKINALEKQLADEKTKYTDLEKEQEDLLVCMGEQDLDIKKYKKRLRELGEAVTDSEDEEE
ncbi:p115 like vesicle tethering protein [Gilbertella persicaria]|uniref:p115 like vesicle tethering protein n=1 Tax=Gilbertella persicaria TaxID=101096 RepID=UPI002221017A|nr:p115 like vesicle tethering protein [Gilbertella persicaria]KAI8084073.1 p115 like vesicle tethering protein [Gilbertella persicaria]